MSSRQLIIFEGPDGGGKTTAIQQFIQLIPTHRTDYTVVHHGPYPRMIMDLPRLYAESMLPAAQGFAAVILDRSWLSEPIYGKAFRQGQDRIGPVNRRHLERLALRCGAVVVNCLPPWEVVLESYKRRKHLEMLEDESQLRRVYDDYASLRYQTHLPVVHYDYTKTTVRKVHRSWRSPAMFMTSCHVGGTCDASVLLVGDDFGHRKDGDMLYQWPFASFNDTGCSKWLTRQLMQAGIPESELAWVNSVELQEFFVDVDPGQFKAIIALGDHADGALTSLKVDHLKTTHPQHAKRFHYSEPYELISLIHQILQETA